MKCPVCQSADLSEGTLTCSHCNSNLEPYQHLSHLDNQIKKFRQATWILGGLLVAAIVLSAALFNTKKSEGTSSANTGEMSKLKNENVQLQNSIAELKKQLEEKEKQMQQQKSAAAETNIITHIVKGGESLWLISQKILGDGNRYMQIAKENNIENPNQLRIGMELKINK